MITGTAPYGPSREAHGPGIHNPNQGRGLVLATRGSRGSLSTNRVPPGGPNTNTVSSNNAMRSVSGSLTTMKEDPEGDLRINNLIFGHSNASRDIGSPSPIGFLPTTHRIQNQTPVSMVICVFFDNRSLLYIQLDWFLLHGESIWLHKSWFVWCIVY